MWFYKLLAGYLILINVTAFFLMLAAKQKARKNKWRIPEATLIGCALIGGSVGALAGMYTFRHKTLNPKFSEGIPVILLMQVALAILIVKYVL